MNLFYLAWRNVISRPLGLALSWILFALGVGLVTFLILFNSQMQEKFDNNLAGINLIIGAKGSPLQLVLCNMYHIDAPTGNISIKAAKAFLNPKHPLIKMAVPLSLGDNYKGYRMVGTTPVFLEMYEMEIREGRNYSKPFEVLIGSDIAQKLELKIGSTFKSSHGIEEIEDMGHDDAFTVVGIMQESQSVVDQLILTDPRSIWDVHDHSVEDIDDDHAGHDHSVEDIDDDHTGHDHSVEDIDDDLAGHDHGVESKDDIVVQKFIPTDSFNLVDHLDKDITALLVRFKGRNFQTLNMARNINQHTDMQAAVPAMEINRLFLMMGVGIDALQWLAIIIVIVSVLSIFISLLQSFKSRKYELAIMRVQGASSVKLFALIILEGVIISIVGYILGSLLGHLSMSWAKEYLDANYRYNFKSWMWHPWEYYIAGGSLLLGVIAALLPAFYAYISDIHKTLGEEVR